MKQRNGRPKHTPAVLGTDWDHAEEEFQSRFTRLTQLTSALSRAVADLEFVEVPSVESGVNFYDKVRRFEISLISRALKRTAGSQVDAAKLLNLRATTLNSKIRQYEIPSDRAHYIPFGIQEKTAEAKIVEKREVGKGKSDDHRRGASK